MFYGLKELLIGGLERDFEQMERNVMKQAGIADECIDDYETLTGNAVNRHCDGDSVLLI